MGVTQVVRDSTVVEHAKVAAQQKRPMYVVHLRVNTYDDASSSVRPGLTRILEGIEEAGWRLEQTSYSPTEEGEPAQLFVFRPSSDTGGQPAYDQQRQQTGGQQPQDPYAGYQYQTGQQYAQGQHYPQHPGYGQPYPGYEQYPGYGQPHPGYGQQYPGYGHQQW